MIDVPFFMSGYELPLLGQPISFFRFFQLFGSLFNWTLNSGLNICSPMVFNLFFNFFRNGVQGSFEKGISCFDKSPFNFSFLFYE